MTEENYNYRTSQSLLRNQFPGKGKLQIPIIPKFQEMPGDFDDLLLIGFDKTNLEDQNHLDRMVHFFLYDYRFERVWKTPDADIERLSRYRAVLSPDFSMYLEMAPVMQLYNVFRNRWCGAYWASKGMRVIPTVNWGDASTFDFCFDGIEKGSAVAVSTYMASEHGNRQDQKEWFLAGYNEMLRRIEPERIICYNTPFPEMQGNIVYVDYERSSWKHMRYEREKQYATEDLESYKIGGQAYLPRDTMSAFMDVQSAKGGGSAYGGKWRPNPDKPKDQRFIGTPGDIKITTNSKGELYETHIGDDGQADYEIHHSDHGNPTQHVNPHRHDVIWDELGPHIVSIERGKKSFVRTKGGILMKSFVPSNTPEQNRFVSISDYKWCLLRGGEVDFWWNGVEYGMTPCGEGKYMIYLYNRPETTAYFPSPDAMLEYMVGEDRLRDVITKVTVLDRTI